MSRLKGIATTAAIVAVVISFESIIYEWGYYRGFSKGSVVMRDAIMCVIERTAEIKPPNYCDRQEAKLWGIIYLTPEMPSGRYLLVMWISL